MGEKTYTFVLLKIVFNLIRRGKSGIKITIHILYSSYKKAQKLDVQNSIKYGNKYSLYAHTIHNNVT